MDDNDLSSSVSSGDHVQIHGGLLAGLTGFVVSIRDAGKCLLKIEGFPAGVFVLAPGRILCTAVPQAEPSAK